MKFLVARHCLTDWNVEKRLQGHTNTPLNAEGRRQAIVLSEKAKSFNPSLVVSSDLLRAQETGGIVTVKLGLSMIIDRRLRECSFGRLEGLTWEEILTHWGIKKESVWRGGQNPYDFTPFGGESKEGALRRYLSVLDEMVTSRPGEFPLLIGHGAALQTLLSFLGEDTRLEFCEVKTIVY